MVILGNPSYFEKSKIDEISDGLCVCQQINEHPYLRFSVWNKKMTDITGYTLDEINKFGWHQMLYPDLEMRRKIQHRLIKAIDGDDIINEERQLTTKDNSNRIVLLNTSITKSEDGNTNLTATFRDITGQRNMEKTLLERTALLNEITENSIDIVSKVDKNLKPIYISPSHKSILGYELEEFYEMSIIDPVHPDDRAFVYNEVLLAFKEKNSKERRIECRYLHKEGHYVWLEVMGKLLFDEAGNITGALFCSRDITKRVMAENTLRENEEQYKCLVNSLPDAVLVHDNGVLIFINDKGIQLLGVNRSVQVVGKQILDFINPHPDYKHSFEERLQQFNKKESLPLTEGKYIRKCDNKILHLEVMLSPFPYKGRTVALVVAKDISEKKFSEELQQKMAEDIRLLNEAIEYDNLRTEFFANISHELRTPLNVILGALQVMELRHNSDGSKCSYTECDRYKYIMKQNCYRLLRIINNLIDFTKIDAGYFQLYQANVDIVDTVENITLSIVEYVKSKGIKLIFDTDAEEKIIACDPDKIERIMLNLISNSIKFTENDGIILVNVSDMGSHVKISVKDTGIGIAKEKQAMIFERFIQVNKSISRRQEGSGIGLSLVKKLVELHGGSICVESEIGKGSEFIIMLPAALIDDTDTMHKEKQCYRNIEKIQIEFSDIYF